MRIQHNKHILKINAAERVHEKKRKRPTLVCPSQGQNEKQTRIVKCLDGLKKINIV